MISTKRTPASAEAQLKSFIAKFEPKRQTLIQRLRRALRKRFPTASELVYDNYNFFVIGYCSTEKPSDCFVSIAAAANGVGLSFYYGARLPDPHKLLEGSGNQNRFLRLTSADVLERRDVTELLEAAADYGKNSLPKTGCGKLIVRSISAKQRPRRREK
ncbi:MAG TPA: DUF1801 domain-containing protein [Candidatus Sulfotelmatobacter sp.]|jgi:hypothetical protein|nr:DUF1801 domain-containing protein [Candidatus Sulfotelmatobacter sp.]